MELFLLGAGRPANGDKPAALKLIAQNTRAMDWQIHSFESFVAPRDVHFLGGYHVNEVIAHYPELNISVVPGWESGGALHTFLNGPFSGGPVIVAYSDTLFRKSAVEAMLALSADVVFGVDSRWRTRYAERTSDDIEAAETMEIDGVEVEYTGLSRFSEKAIGAVQSQDGIDPGGKFPDLIEQLRHSGLSVQSFDLAGDWAEFNAASDIARFILGSKAETLSRLQPLVRHSCIGDQVTFTPPEWADDEERIHRLIQAKFGSRPVIVRSSSADEDGWETSNAGGFESRLDVDPSNDSELREAIAAVVGSYHSDRVGDDQVLVQEFVSDVRSAGVVFTSGLESGSPYYRINFDDSGSTESATAGVGDSLRTVIVNRSRPDLLAEVEPALVGVIQAVQELEQLLGYDKLDIEFAIDREGRVLIFQVRPLTVEHESNDISSELVEEALGASCETFASHQSRRPFVHGETTIFGNMPDWNPAEIIGIRPKPLALSLYRTLITNHVWAEQRHEFGYLDVRPAPLIYTFAGQPYVDTRASFNSFIPAELPWELRDKLARAYLSLLAENPSWHDKIEFEIAFTIWTQDFAANAKQRLGPHAISEPEIAQLGEALKDITRNALQRLAADLTPVDTMNQRRQRIADSDSPLIEKIWGLIDDCRRFGTLSFSHAARAGFVATTILRSFVATGVMTEARVQAFLKSFSTVAGEFEADRWRVANGELPAGDLIREYGHLRPGTYEITAPAYHEDPERYLLGVPATSHAADSTAFELSPEEADTFIAFLAELGSSLGPEELLGYMAAAIQAREAVKFDFTRNLSAALDYCAELGAAVGLSRSDMSFMEFNDLEHMRLGLPPLTNLENLVGRRKREYAVTQQIELPPLLRSTNDLFCFERLSSKPNFVTLGKVHAGIQQVSMEGGSSLSSNIALIEQADPGYDWLFTEGIVGLITQYGGANSHMAIRAAEIGLPSAIGVGAKLFEQLSHAQIVELDCQNQTIRVLQ